MIASAGLKRTYRDKGPNAVGIAVSPVIRCCQIISSDISLKVKPGSQPCILSVRPSTFLPRHFNARPSSHDIDCSEWLLYAVSKLLFYMVLMHTQWKTRR